MTNSLLSYRQHEIFAEQVKLLYQQTKSEVKSNLIPPLLMSYVFFDYIDHTVLFTWLILIESVILFKIVLIFIYDRYSKKNGWVLHNIIANTLKGLIASLLFVSLDLQENTFIAVIYSGILIILSNLMAHVLASVPNAYVFPSIAIHFPVAIKSFLDGSPAFALLGVCYVIGCFQFIALNRNSSKTILESITLRFEKNDLIEELEQKKQDAEQANLLKTKFLAAASHDLRQPLHTMNLFLEILNNKVSNQEQQELVNKISLSNESLTKMLNTLLDISKLDANTVEINNSHFSLNSFYASLSNEFSPLAKQKKLQLQLDISSNTVVYSDIFHLDRILRNLLSNAIKYTEQGKVVLSCTDNSNDTYTLCVSDTGIGIPPAKQGEIFNEFYQLNNSERDRQKGLGLGLSIVRRLCFLLGSEIKLCSTENKGTKFFFTLPKGNASTIDVTDKVQHQILFPDLNILLIDDEPDILEAMGKLLKLWGCMVETAESTDSALALLKQKNYRPKVIISDYRLRDNKTGFNAIHAIRADLGDLTLPAIVLTGDTTPEVIKQCKESKFLLLYKPVKPAKLLSTLNSALRNQY